MKKTSETIVFFGSGPVAAKSLESLTRNFAIEAVVTKPRPIHHKGAVPVLDMAEKLGLSTCAVNDKQSLDDLFEGKPFDSRLGVLVDFGIIASQKVIDYFPLGIVNSHFSLLPEWRGADPITFAILSGQKKTGVSLMLLAAALDEGLLLAQTACDIPRDFTTPSLTSALIELSNESLRTIIPLWLKGEIQAAPQEAVTMAASTTPSYSRKLTRQDGILDWQKPAEVLEREVRAFAGWPQSRTTLGTRDVIITKAHVVKTTRSVGQLLLRGRSLTVCTQHNGLAIDRLKPAGKAEMTVEAFLAGYRQTLNLT